MLPPWRLYIRPTFVTSWSTVAQFVLHNMLRISQSSKEFNEGSLECLSAIAIFLMKIPWELIISIPSLPGVCFYLVFYFLRFCIVGVSHSFRCWLSSQIPGLVAKGYESACRITIRIVANPGLFPAIPIPIWNNLPAACAEAPNLSIYKGQLWVHFETIGIHWSPLLLH